MDFFREMLSLQETLFLLILLGVLVKKLKIVSETGRKTLSDLLINVILSCNIMESFLGGAISRLALCTTVFWRSASLWGSSWSRCTAANCYSAGILGKRKAYCQFALTPALQDCLLPISMLVDKYGGDAVFASQITLPLPFAPSLF